MDQSKITEAWNRAKAEENTPGIEIPVDDHEQVISISYSLPRGQEIYIRHKDPKTQAWGTGKS